MHHRLALGAACAAAFVLAPGLASATRILPLGDSLTEGLCTNGLHAGEPNATCTDPYGAGNRDTLEHFRSEPSFCGAFARRMVEDYNPGATGGYRSWLLQELVGAGIDATFVGSVHSGSALDATTNAHDGHSGWTVEQLDYCAAGYAAHGSVPAFAGYVADARPDLVLLQVGTNDILNGAAAAPLAEQVIGMLERVRAAAPQARVIVALPPKRYAFPAASTEPDLRFGAVRDAFAAHVAHDSGRDFPCTAGDLVDMGVLDAIDMTWGDATRGIHPSGFGYRKMAQAWAHSITTPECRFDTRAFIEVGGMLVESVTAYGRYWNYDASTGTVLSNGALAGPEAARYAAICSGQPVCVFDTRTMTGSAAAPVESITAFDHYHDIALDGTPIASGLLSSVARYRPICALARDAAHCTFDTRNVIGRGGTQVETITAYGHWFEFDQGSHARLGSGALASVERYAPICASMPPAETQCRFDTRAFVHLWPDSPLFESITAYGHYWNFDDRGRLVGDGSLDSIQRYHPDAAARRP